MHIAHSGRCAARRSSVPSVLRGPPDDGGRVGLLFQPRRTASAAARVAHHPGIDPPLDRSSVFLAALEAVLLGDASRFAELFSEDVEITSPHLSVTSLGSLQRELGVPEDSLSDIGVVVVALDAVADKLIA